MTTHVPTTPSEPIAIIGMGCRFPGGVESPEDFWQLLRTGKDAIREVPPNRWDLETFYNPDPDAPGKMYTRHGGFLDQVDKFDPQFFNISPREALSLDPQQRLLLEVTWEALENAYLIPEKLHGSSAGVFVGISNSDYISNAITSLQEDIANRIDAYFGTGNAFSTASGRLSYFLRLTGPNMAVDTACSSSLVALHLACQSLRTRECHLAIAAGVNMVLSPGTNIAFSRARMLAPDGHCKTFDAAADGYVRGEGCGVLILKRLTEARADGDHILALIHSSAINQDGPSSGLTVPSGPSQAAVIRQALANAGLTPQQISYVEAHGTGTFLGDPIEAGALSDVFGVERSEPLFIGSVKTNIGHLESAAGMASVIKTVLALQHHEIPRHLHFHTLNPHIPWAGLPFIVPTEHLPWEAESRFASISGFGFSGTNAHLILGEDTSAAPAATTSHNHGDAAAAVQRPLHLLTLSAKTDESLKALAGRYLNLLNTQTCWREVCYTANTTRSTFRQRLAMIAATAEEARETLNAFLNDQPTPNIVRGQSANTSHGKIAFLFTGQGGQYLNMGRQLYETHSTFHRLIDQCEEILRPHLNMPLRAVLYPESESHNLIHETAYTQPALFAIEYALTAVWHELGITPDVVLGHSVGEYVAACVAGVFSLEEGLKLIAQRGRLMQTLPQNGRMAAIFADSAKVRAAMAGYEDQVSIAAFNGPENVVISGAESAVTAILNSLTAEGIKWQGLEVSHAFHSPLMNPILDEFEEAAQKVNYAPPKIKLISNLSGRLVEEAHITNANYWRAHIRQPVQFETGMQSLEQLDCQTFIEIGPQPVLVSLGRQCLTGNKGRWLPTLRRDRADWQQLWQSAGELFVQGIALDWSTDNEVSHQRVPLPTYPFQRQRYWLDMRLDENGQPVENTQSSKNAKPHPLLGKQMALAQATSTHFESLVGINTPTFLNDHRILGKAFFPGTGSLEIALAAGSAYFKSSQLIIEEAAIEEPLILPEDKKVRLQTVLTPLDEHTVSFQVFSLASEADEHPLWIRHGSGRMRRNEDPTSEGVDLAALHAQWDRREIFPEAYYQQIQIAGFNYGARFRTLTQIKHLTSSNGDTSSSLVKVELASAFQAEAEEYLLHPALLDGCFHIGAAAFDGRNTLSLPIRLTQLVLHKPHATQVWAHVQMRSGTEEGTRFISLRLYDEHGQSIAEVEGISQRVDQRKLSKLLHGDIKQRLYEIVWEPKPATDAAASQVGETSHLWVIFQDQAGVGAQVATQLQARGETPILISRGAEFKTLQPAHYQLNPLAPNDFAQLWQTLPLEHPHPLRGILYLWGADADTSSPNTLDTINTWQERTCASALHLIQTFVARGELHTPQLWVITRGAQAVGGTPVQAVQTSLWSLSGAIALEHPEFGCQRIDLDPETTANAAQELFDSIWFTDREDQIAYRAGVRYAARLRHYGQTAEAREVRPLPETPFKLAITQYGLLENLHFEHISRPALASDEIEIEVRAAGLNLRDVLNALGMLKEFAAELGIDEATQLPFGGEAAGVVSAIGETVTSFKVGDEVFAGLAIGSLASHVTVKAETAILKPAHLTFAEAATLPTAFLTAYYGLHTLAHLKSGDKVLIHAAAGGVGQAAVQLAQQAGAEIFATASPGKWGFLKKQGVAHIFNSRTLDYAEQIQQLTAGAGVDIVFNSLNGEFITKNLDVLRIGGCYVELGKLGILSPTQMHEQRPDVTYFPFDLLEIALRQPETLHQLLNDFKEALRVGRMTPLPYQSFAMEEVVPAFRYMAQSKHIGKIILTLPETFAANAAVPATPSIKIQEDASYLITGGLGSLGSLVAHWLLAQGARHLILTGRQGAETLQAQRLVHFLQNSGAQVTVVKADISNEEEAINLLSQIKRDLPPLRGVIHAAGVLEDGTLRQQTWARFENVMRPKVAGTWNLHTHTQQCHLDFFICFSSIAALLGSPGQGNYAAANAFMDGLMQERRRRGLVGMSLNWGPWAEVGMAAELSQRHRARQATLGLEPLLPVVGLHALQEVLALNPNQTAIVSVNWQKFFQQFPLANEVPLLESFSTRKGGFTGRSELLEQLRAAPPAEQKKMLFNYLRTELARILGLGSPEQIEPQQRFLDFGLDSLMAIELKSSLEAGVGRTLPATMVFNYPTLEAVVNYLVDEVLDLAQTTTSKGLPPTSAETVVAKHSPLIPIQPNGDRTPLFCIHPVGGSIFCYQKLAHYLSEAQPLYGLQSLGINGEQEPLTSIEEMSTRYIEALQTVQPQGPYQLAGWSMGGVIALEMAQQLIARGEKIASFIIIDAFLPQADKGMPKEFDEVTLLMMLAKDLSQALGLDLPLSETYLRQMKADEQLHYVLKQAQQSNVLPPETKLDYLRQMLTVFKANHRALANYTPKSFAGHIELFYAAQRGEKGNLELIQAWEKLAGNGLMRYAVAGNHYEIWQEPNLQTLAAEIEKCLRTDSDEMS